MQTWDLFPQGLSAFDVHEQTEVFAAYVISSNFPMIYIADYTYLVQYVLAHGVKLAYPAHGSAVARDEAGARLAHDGPRDPATTRLDDTIHAAHEQSRVPPT